MISKVNGRQEIKLLKYYKEFSAYYPNCEMKTKKWFVENAKPDWVYIDAGANVGIYSILFSQLSRMDWFTPLSQLKQLPSLMKIFKPISVQTFVLFEMPLETSREK